MRQLYNSEDEIFYTTTAFTKKQASEDQIPQNALTMESYSLDEAKGIAKGMLWANKKYVYSFVSKITMGYVGNNWSTKNIELVYDTWAYDEDDQGDKSTFS